MHLSQVIFEADALSVIQAINDKLTGNDFGHIIQELQQAKHSFARCFFKHVCRCCNKVAHELAQFARRSKSTIMERCCTTFYVAFNLSWLIVTSYLGKLFCCILFFFIILSFPLPKKKNTHKDSFCFNPTRFHHIIKLRRWWIYYQRHLIMFWPMLEVLVPKKSFNRYQNFQCCALRALALGCVKLSIYFSIKTYFSYFTKTFSKNINISLSVLKIYFNIILKFSLFFMNSFILLSPLLSQVINSHNCHCSLP